MITNDSVIVSRLTPNSCNDVFYVPSTTEYFEDMLIPEFVAMLTAWVITAFTFAVYFELLYTAVCRYEEVLLNQPHTVWILTVVPVTSFCAALSLCLPRSELMFNVIRSIVFALGMVHFVLELLFNSGSVAQIIKDLDTQKIPVGSPPLCCFRCCCPVFTLNKVTFRAIAILLLQSVVVQPLSAVLLFVLGMEGIYHPGRPDNSTVLRVILSVVKILSCMSGVYGVSLISAAAKPVTETLHITPKHIILKAWLILVNFQGLIFDFLESLHIPSCVGRLSSAVRGEVLFNSILVVEMSIICVLVRCMYHRLETRRLHKSCACWEHDGDKSIHKVGQTGIKDFCDCARKNKPSIAKIDKSIHKVDQNGIDSNCLCTSKKKLSREEDDKSINKNGLTNSNYRICCDRKKEPSREEYEVVEVNDDICNTTNIDTGRRRHSHRHGTDCLMPSKHLVTSANVFKASRPIQGNAQPCEAMDIVGLPGRHAKPYGAMDIVGLPDQLHH